MSELLFKLLVGHAFADFVFQTDFMAINKNRHAAVLAGFWPYVLSAHALVHGGFVFLATGSVWLGVAETVVHWAIDFGKCEKWYGIHSDQGLHIVFKFIWLWIASCGG